MSRRSPQHRRVASRKRSASAVVGRKTPWWGDTMSMLLKDNTANPQRGSPHCTAPVFSSSPQRPSLHTTPRIWLVREPSIVDECGRHSDLPMDRNGATTGTYTRPMGWTLDPPVVHRLRKTSSSLTARGNMALRQLVHVLTNTAAEGHMFRGHRWRHRTPFLSKSKHARNHPTGGPERAGRTSFACGPQGGGGACAGGEYIYAKICVFVVLHVAGVWAYFHP